MKKQIGVILLTILFLFQFTFIIYADEQQVLSSDTPVYLQLEEKVTSGLSETATKVRYKVIREVRNNDGQVLIPYHAIAYGTVLNSQKHTLVQPGEVLISLDHVIGPNGKIILLKGRQEARGGSHMVFLGFALARVYEEAVIPGNSLVKAYVASDTLIPTEEKSSYIGFEDKRSIEIEAPSDNSVYQKDERIYVFCNVEPLQDVDNTRILFNDKVVYEQKGEPDIIVINCKKLNRGSYQVIAEPQFLNGETIRSTPKTIIIK